MIDIKKILEDGKKALELHNTYVARTPYASSDLTGESKVILETIIKVVNEELADVRKDINEVLEFIHEVNDKAEEITKEET